MKNKPIIIKVLLAMLPLSKLDARTQTIRCTYMDRSYVIEIPSSGTLVHLIAELQTRIPIPTNVKIALWRGDPRNYRPDPYCITIHEDIESGNLLGKINLEIRNLLNAIKLRLSIVTRPKQNPLRSSQLAILQNFINKFDHFHESNLTLENVEINLNLHLDNSCNMTISRVDEVGQKTIINYSHQGYTKSDQPTPIVEYILRVDNDYMRLFSANPTIDISLMDLPDEIMSAERIALPYLEPPKFEEPQGTETNP